MESYKLLKDLNLLDRFLFAEAMQDPVIMRTVLEIILGPDIVLQQLPQTEKEQRTSPLNRFVKLDVWALDIDNTVYDTEVQKENTYNLPKRSRLYQGMIDTKLLEPGEIDFNKLNKVYVIIIMPFDLFGKGLYQYTFQMRCDEFPELALKDEATRIFLNTHGTQKGNTSQELIDLLHYIENTTKAVSDSSMSEKIKSLEQRIEAIKSNESVGVKYMQEWEERTIEQQKAREEGIVAERESTRKKLIKTVIKKIKKNKSLEICADELEEEPEAIRPIYEAVKQHGGDADIDLLYDLVYPKCKENQ